MKSYTDLEQSKKLKEILNEETADLWWDTYEFAPRLEKHYHEYLSRSIPPIPCWSLAALLDVLPDYTLQTNTDRTVFVVCDSKKPMISNAYDNPIDACYEMIIKLKEQNLL